MSEGVANASPIGALPAHWAVKPFQAVVSPLGRKNIGLTETNLLSLSYGSIIKKDIDALEGLLPESFEGYQIVEKNDLVFRFTDLQNDQRSLRSGLVQERGIITSAYLAVRPRGLDPRFFSYLMRAYDQEKVFYSFGGGVRQSLKFGDVKRLPVPVPDVAEQRRIAEFLDRETAQIDALIAKQQQLISTLAERRLAELTRCVNQGLAEAVAMNVTGDQAVGLIPGHWRFVRLSHLFSMIGSGTTPPSEQSPDYYGGGIPWVTTGELRESTITATAKTVTAEAVKSLSALKVYPAGSLVLAMYGATIGRLGVLGVPAATNQACSVLGGPKGITSDFAYFALQASKARLLLLAYGGGQPNISQEVVRSLRIAVPPIEEQRTISAHLRSVLRSLDELATRGEQVISVMLERRQALISAAVTGKVDLGTRS